MAEVDDEQTLDDVPPNLDEALRPHRSRRQRIWQGVLMALALVVALGVIVQPKVASWLPESIGGQTLVVSSNVSGARVQVRGPNVQLAGHTPYHHTLPRSLFPYSFTITLTVPPFTVQTCRMSVPHQATDSCVLAPFQITHGYAEPLKVQFRLGLNDLAADQAGAVLVAVEQFQRASVQETLIPVGGHYGLAAPLNSRVATADTPLLATLETMVDPGQATGCLAICPGEPFFSVPEKMQSNQLAPPRWWAIQMNIVQQWRVEDATSGQVLRMYPESQLPVLLNLIAAWDGAHWLIRRQMIDASGIPLPGDSFGRRLTGICDDARLIFTNLLFQEALGVLDPNLTLGDHGVEGCVIRTHLTQIGQTVAVPVGFLWRFGQMYAVDTQTLALVANFPLANGVDLVPFASDLAG